MPYIASTMAASVNYVDYKTNTATGPHKRLQHVTIKGGAGVAKKGGPDGVLTPEGIVTKVSDEELSFLMKDEVFQTHLKFGHVKVLKMNVEGDKAARDMTKKDPSAPLTEADSKEGGRIPGAKMKLGLTKPE